LIGKTTFAKPIDIGEYPVLIKDIDAGFIKIQLDLFQDFTVDLPGLLVN